MPNIDWAKERATDLFQGRARHVAFLFPLCPPGLSVEETEQAMLAVCQPLWDAGEIPVVGWACEFDGTELHPPTQQ